jgi:hypothetical protein
VILMHILLGVGEDQVGLKVLAEFEEIFENFLTRVREDARMEWTKELPSPLVLPKCSSSGDARF